MLFLLAIMLGVSFAIETNFFSQIVLWGAFVYIIGKELVDEYREYHRPDEEARIKRQILEKLDRSIDQIKKIV
jgi:hypothetical protein